MSGLSAEQRALFDARRCARGHKFDGANYPTPEGECPLCAAPEVSEQIGEYQRLVAEQPAHPREPLHQSIGLFDQSASPSLTALSER